jgi:hypothetical protein
VGNSREKLFYMHKIQTNTKRYNFFGNNSFFPLQGRRHSRISPTKTLAATATRPPNKRATSAKLARKMQFKMKLLSNKNEIWYIKKWSRPTPNSLSTFKPEVGKKWEKSGKNHADRN